MGLRLVKCLVAVFKCCVIWGKDSTVTLSSWGFDAYHTLLLQFKTWWWFIIYMKHLIWIIIKPNIFFVCFKVHLKSDPSCKFALKTIRKQAIQSPGQRERMLSEKHILMDLQSPFIVRSEHTPGSSGSLWSTLSSAENLLIYRWCFIKGSSDL